jgi:tetratricopeptide (TPR) repeat protein
VFSQTNAEQSTTPDTAFCEGPATVAELCRVAAGALKNGNLATAESCLQAALAAGAKHLSVLRDLAGVYLQTGDLARAGEYSAAWVAQAPQDVEARLLALRIAMISARISESRDLACGLLNYLSSTKALREAARFFKDSSDEESYAVAIAALASLADQAIAKGSHGEAIGVVRVLLQLNESKLVERLLTAAGKFSSPELASARVEHLVRRGLFAQAVEQAQSLASRQYSTANLVALAHYAQDRVAIAEAVTGSPPIVAPPLLDPALVDLLKETGARTFVVFHADHFQPWTPQFEPFATQIEPWQLAACEAFAEAIRRHAYTRKLTLFYTPVTLFELAGGGEPMAPDLTAQGVVAVGRNNKDQSRIAEAMAGLREGCGAEFHLHIHHEDLIPCRKSWGVTAAMVARYVPSERHKSLLELHVRANLEQLSRDTGVQLASWATVHGHWALNGSDRNACNIDDEISRLQALGCWGDFTFPAGRRHCSPHAVRPFTLAARACSKSYDRLDADLRMLGEHPAEQLWETRRFFVWSTPLPNSALSLDYYSLNSVLPQYEPDDILRMWITGGVRERDTIYIKTHAHSMAPGHLHDSGPVFPHFFPRNQRLFALLERVCDRAGVELCYETVNEVRRRLTA